MLFVESFFLFLACGVQLDNGVTSLWFVCVCLGEVG